MSTYMPDLTEAACATPFGRHIFDDITPATIPVARSICQDCPVAQQCLNWAVQHEDFGMWGGHTKDQLRAERSRHGIRLQELSESWLSGRAPQKKREAAA
jgi:hypothetical protein